MKAVILTTISLLAFAGNSILCRMTLGEQEIDAASFTSIRLLSGIISLRVKMISSWPNGIVYFWLSGQLLCKAQRREHSRSYVTVVVTPHDCMDAGARATQEQLPGVTAHLVRKYDFIWLTT